MQPRERGYKVERPVLDADLRDLARQNGVRVLEGRAATRVEAGVDGIGSRCLVVATGKWTGSRIVSAVVEDSLPATVALSAILENAGAADATVIEAVAEGWLWWLPMRSGRVCVSLFCDLAELRARGRESLWRSALAEARGPART